MQNNPQTRAIIDNTTFVDGVNSYLEPQLLKNSQVRWAINAVCKGGIWRTRPGYKTKLTVNLAEGSPFYDWYVAAGSPSVHPQFMTIFRPTGDVEYLVFGISGSVWSARSRGDNNFDTPQRILGISFDPSVSQIAWASTVKSTDIVAGSVVTIAPRRYLIMQDGLSRAAYWNGLAGGHLNPEKRITVDGDGNTIYVPGYNQTRIGKWMAWSGNRLWVANGSQVYASDLNDPLSFTEELAPINVPVINFPEDVTGIRDRGTSGLTQSQVFVFTRFATYTLFSGVQKRQPEVLAGSPASYSGGWINTPDFQRKVFDNVGCVAGKSISSHRGILHWYSEDGIVSFDSSGTVTSSQALPPIDNVMSYSKRMMCPDKSTTCVVGRDSYVGWSVPTGATINGRIYNRHTQVLDKSVLPIQGSDSISAWQGIWTGINPVEWATGPVQGINRTFALSMDSDGVVRIWEGFMGSRADNGYRIPWAVETKMHEVTESPFVNNKFLYPAIGISELQGNLSITPGWKGLRGQYHYLPELNITATPGVILLPTQEFAEIFNNTPAYNLKRQRRIINFENNRGELSGCDSAGVESEKTDTVDSAFSLIFKFRGSGAMWAYRIATDLYADNTEGSVPEDEVGIKMLPATPTECPTADAELPTPDYLLPDDNVNEAFFPTSADFSEEAYAAPAP